MKPFLYVPCTRGEAEAWRVAWGRFLLAPFFFLRAYSALASLRACGSALKRLPPRFLSRLPTVTPVNEAPPPTFVLTL